MNKADLQPMFDYHYWAHRRVWDCLMTLTDAQFEEDLRYSIGSIRRQCVHTMFVERFWLDVVRGTVHEDRADVPKPEQLTTRELIRAAWDALEAETRDYLHSVSDDDLEAILHYDFPWCGAQSHPRWQALIYIVTHAVDHRAQMLAGIHRLGGETLMQDFIRFKWGLES
jgi:uncharacterized damage-inducible protein DinB